MIYILGFDRRSSWAIYEKPSGNRFSRWIVGSDKRISCRRRVHGQQNLQKHAKPRTKKKNNSLTTTLRTRTSGGFSGSYRAEHPVNLIFALPPDTILLYQKMRAGTAARRSGTNLRRCVHRGAHLSSGQVLLPGLLRQIFCVVYSGRLALI